MTITTNVTVNHKVLPVHVKIGLNDLIEVNADGEGGDNFRNVLLAALETLELEAGDFIAEDGSLRETVTLLRGGTARPVTDFDEEVEEGDTVVVNQPSRNG